MKLKTAFLATAVALASMVATNAQATGFVTEVSPFVGYGHTTFSPSLIEKEGADYTYPTNTNFVIGVQANLFQFDLPQAPALALKVGARGEMLLGSEKTISYPKANFTYGGNDYFGGVTAEADYKFMPGASVFARAMLGVDAANIDLNQTNTTTSTTSEAGTSTTVTQSSSTTVKGTNFSLSYGVQGGVTFLNSKASVAVGYRMAAKEERPDLNTDFLTFTVGYRF